MEEEEEEEEEEVEKKTKTRASPSLVSLCLESASSSKDNVETWRRQKRTLERLPPHLADVIFRRLLRLRLLYPSLLEVFQRCVEEVDLRGEWNVDAEWMAYLGGFRHLRSLNLADCRGINNSALWPITGLNSLKELNLSRCSKITDAGIKHVLSLSSLEKLYVSQTGLTADGVKLLSSLINLQFLDLGGVPVTDKTFSSLQVLTQLEYLDLWGTEISNTGASILKMFQKLNYLNLAWTNVTEVPYLPSVRYLNMSNCTLHSIFNGETTAKVPLSKLLLTGASVVDANELLTNVETTYLIFLDISGFSISNFNFLIDLRRLEHLDLSSSTMTDNFIEHVAHIGDNLRYLNLSKTNITSQAIGILVGHVQNLETLSVSHTAIDDASLLFISMMTSLRSLDLSHTNITGFESSNEENAGETSSLRELLDLSLLEDLNLEDTLVSDEGIYPLAFFRCLKHLYLKSDRFTDIGLLALSSPLPKLQTLGFRNAVLTSSGLKEYQPPPRLHMLDLRGSWLLTANDVSSFCSRFQQIEVKHEHLSTLPDQTPSTSLSKSAKSTPALKSRLRGAKLSEAPKVNFVDERIKYSLEELLELQLSPLSSLTMEEIGMVLPDALKKV